MSNKNAIAQTEEEGEYTTLGSEAESGFFISQSYRISLPHTVPGLANVQEGN